MLKLNFSTTGADFERFGREFISGWGHAGCNSTARTCERANKFAHLGTSGGEERAIACRITTNVRHLFDFAAVHVYGACSILRRLFYVATLVRFCNTCSMLRHLFGFATLLRFSVNCLILQGFN